MKKRVLVFGSTGLVGSCLIDALLTDDYYDEIICFVRKKTDINSLKLREIEIDFETFNFDGNYFENAIIFCCLGTTIKKVNYNKEAFKHIDVYLPFKIASLAKEHCSSSFLIVSSMGANAKSSIFYNKTKGEMESTILKLHLSILHIFRPSLLMGKRHEKRSGELLSKFIYPFFSIFFIGPLKKHRAIEAKTVAIAMVQKSKDATKGNFIYQSDKIEEIADL